MELADLQDAIVDRLRPACQRMAARHPGFVARVVRRLVLRTPETERGYIYFRVYDEQQEFIADVALAEATERPIGLAESVWLAILLQILLPALIQAFLLWWHADELHQRALRELRQRLEAALDSQRQSAAGPPPAGLWQNGRLWGTLVFVLAAAMIAIVAIAALGGEPEELPAPPAAAAPLPHGGHVEVRVRDVLDGDTLSGDLLLPFGVTLRAVRLRLRDFDAWEASRHRSGVVITELELVKGRAATDALRSLLSECDGVYAQAEAEPEWKFGRLMVKLSVDPRGPRTTLVDVGQYMTEAGHARKEE